MVSRVMHCWAHVWLQSYRPDLMQAMVAYLKAQWISHKGEQPDLSGWRLHQRAVPDVDIPAQTDSHSCGVYAVVFAQCLAAGYPLASCGVSAATAIAARAHIVHDLLQASQTASLVPMLPLNNLSNYLKYKCLTVHIHNMSNAIMVQHYACKVGQQPTISLLFPCRSQPLPLGLHCSMNDMSPSQFLRSLMKTTVR